MSDSEEPEEAGGAGTRDEREDEGSPRERAKRLSVQLRVLRMRERSANFEDREAIRREIRRKEEALTRLADAGDFEVDVDVRRG